MIAIITVLIMTAASYFYFQYGVMDTFLLFIAGMCVAIGLNWFCRPKNVTGKFFSTDYVLNHTARIQKFSGGDREFGGYARMFEYNGTMLVKIVVEEDGQFKEKFIPNDYACFSIVEEGEEPAVKIYGASQYVWGNIAFSIFPGRAFSAKFTVCVKY